MPLTDRDRLLLDFEAQWNGHDAAKEEAIGRELALSPARFYQLLERVIDQPDAVVYDAMLVHRLRRMRDARLREHAARASVRTGAAG